MNLVAAGNTYNPCLLILRRKGYALSVDEGANSSVWNAEKEGATFSAYSPPELLGLICLGEEFGERWNVQEPNVLGELLNDPDG